MLQPDAIMQKTMLLALLLFVYTLDVRSQETGNTPQHRTDSIEITKSFGGYRFYQHNQQLSLKQLQNQLQPNDAAYKLVKSARGSNTFATILGAAGGFLVGWPLGTAIGGGDPNWTMAAIGGGLIGVSVPVSIGANKKLKKAVAIYNDALVTTGSKPSPLQLQFKHGAGGMGLAICF